MTSDEKKQLNLFIDTDRFFRLIKNLAFTQKAILSHKTTQSCPCLPTCDYFLAARPSLLYYNVLNKAF